MSKATTAKRAERKQHLNAVIDRAQDANLLESWNAFIAPFEVPMDVMPALMTGRTELLAAVQPRALSEVEARAMFGLVSVLIRTNVALREHAEALAHMVEIWSTSFKQLESVGHRIEAFANFRKSSADDGEF